MDHPETVQMAQWGFIGALANNKSISPKLYNLPANSAFERPTYRRSLGTNRCVIPADGFFAWKQVSKKQRIPYYFYFNDRSVFGIAGIWEGYEDMEGNFSRSFNMMTIDTAENLSYQEDMPAILKPEQFSQWLSPETAMESLSEMLGHAGSRDLQSHPVSPLLINSVSNDPKVIAPTPPSDQFGNYTLFS